MAEAEEPTENEDQIAPVRLISANNRRVTINEFAFHRQMEEDLTVTRKLIMRTGHGHGRQIWTFELVAVQIEGFSTREEFDQIMLTRVPDLIQNGPLETIAKIPLVVAIRKLGPQLSVNMKYILENSADVLKENYRAKVEEIGEKGAKRLVLNSFLESLLGQSEKGGDPAKGRFCISDFHYYGKKGTDYYATAKLGENYLFLYYSIT